MQEAEDKNVNPGGSELRHLKVKLVVTPDRAQNQVSVLMLTPRWKFDDYGMATITRSQIKTLRSIDPDGEFIKITCAVLEDDEHLIEQKVDARQLNVELIGYTQPRWRPKTNPSIEWLNSLLPVYYSPLVSGMKYDFIIGHAPYVADGCLTLKEHYKQAKHESKVILLLHKLPQNGTDELNKQLRETYVVFSMVTSVDEKISRLPNKPMFHKIYLPGYPLELFNINRQKGKEDVQTVAMMTFEKKNLQVQGLDFSFAVNSIRKVTQRTNTKVNLTMLTEKEDEKTVWEAEFDDAFASKPKDITFECSSDQNMKKLKESNLFLLPMKLDSPLFGIETLSAIASEVPVLISEHCAVASFLSKMKEKQVVATDTGVSELVKESVVSGTDEESWADRIVNNTSDEARRRAELLKKCLLFDTSISSSHLDFSKIITESSCVRLDLEMDTRRKVPKKGLDTFRSMGVELEAELETDPEKCIVAFLKHLLLQREKLREGVLQTHLGTHRETVDWWEKFLESLEQKKRKLIDVEEGSVNLTLFCPTKESFEQLEDETWTAGVTTKFRKLLSLLGLNESYRKIESDSGLYNTPPPSEVPHSTDHPVEISVLLLTKVWPFDFSSLTTVTRSLISILRQNDDTGPKLKITCAVLDQNGKIDMVHLEEALSEKVNLRGMVCPKGEEIKLPEIRRINELSAAYYHHLFDEDSYHFIVGHAPMMAHGAVNLKNVCKGNKAPKVVLVIHGLPKTEEGFLNSKLLLSWIKNTDIVFSIGEVDKNVLKRYTYGMQYETYIPIYKFDSAEITSAEEGKRHQITILNGRELGYTYIDLKLAVDAADKAAEQIQRVRKSGKAKISVQILSGVEKIQDDHDTGTHTFQVRNKDSLSITYFQPEDIETLMVRMMGTDLLLLPLEEKYPVFGIEALNAAVAGIPILVSEESGMAALLRDIEENKESIVRVTPGREISGWADKIEGKLTDPMAFDKAKRLKLELLNDARIARIRGNLLSALGAGEKEEGKGTTNTEISLPNVSKTTDPKGVSVEHEERIALPDSKEDNPPELTDVHLINLSEKITNEEDLRKLCIVGLKFKDNPGVQDYINSHRKTSSAALELLTDWLISQDDRRSAHKNLCESLKTVQFNLLVNELK